MTTLPLLPLVVVLGAIALIGLTLIAIRRRSAPLDVVVATVDDAADGEQVEEDIAVPFTHLGVDVEPPRAPDWTLREVCAAPRTATRVTAPLALAHVDKATAILREHAREESSSIVPWLMLLELYRTHGREQALAEVARDFRERFHARREGTDAVRGGADGGLEAFPPVMRLVTMLWGTHECRDLLERLLRDRTEGRRLGLSRAAYIDIATLSQLLGTLLAELDADSAEEAKVRAAWRAATYVAQMRAA